MIGQLASVCGLLVRDQRIVSRRVAYYFGDSTVISGKFLSYRSHRTRIQAAAQANSYAIGRQAICYYCLEEFSEPFEVILVSGITNSLLRRRVPITSDF